MAIGTGTIFIVLGILGGLLSIWLWQKHDKTLRPWGDVYGVLALLSLIPFLCFLLLLLYAAIIATVMFVADR